MSLMNSIAGSVKLARSEGYDITEYSLRRWVRSGTVPSVRAGSKYLVFWPNLERFLCGGEPCKESKEDTATIRKLEV